MCFVDLRIYDIVEDPEPFNELDTNTRATCVYFNKVLKHWSRTKTCLFLNLTRGVLEKKTLGALNLDDLTISISPKNTSSEWVRLLTCLSRTI